MGLQVVRGQNWRWITIFLRFILRWNKNYHLIWHAHRRCQRKTGVLALPIHLPDDERQLFLVVSRPGYGRKPWYLIITEPVHNAEQAWQIEMSLRFTLLL